MVTSRIFITGGSGFIGTNLIFDLEKNTFVEILNVDIKKPKAQSQVQYWQACDIRDTVILSKLLASFRPDVIIHLAARTDLDGVSIEEYSTNTDGTTSLLDALSEVGFAGPAIFTSSMYVCRPGYQPTSDTDFCPHTVYGQSKAIGEQIIRASDPSYPWVITRPTSIWGPWFGTPYADFFKMVLSKKYVNIVGNRTVKTYGYVGNTVAQILATIKCAEDLKSRVVYLGDGPAYVINDWADEISAFVPYRIARIPHFVLRGLALLGDVTKFFGVRFPMTTFRLRNMTTNNVHDLSLVERAMVTPLPFTRQEGNERTVEWLRTSSSSL